ncbi:MAG: beta-ketoacyl-[acyl-carrier-protein] synthase family protein [Candidatus Riflebacteria bacterium]|nr:beta-ketoacyl-[acyl-carrier-protein] synthase family protein [Candidatus Riflebacteria bacterium]
MTRRRRVLITGCGIITAAATGMEAFFDALAAGRSGLGLIQRFDTSCLATRVGGEVDIERLSPPPPLFSSQIWNRPRDTKAFLAWEALRQIIATPGLSPETALISTVGLERIDLDALIAATAAAEATPGAPPPEPICPEIPLTQLPGLLWRAAGFTGPISIQAAACAAGTIALGTAFRAIRAGSCDRIVAGGVDSLIFPYGIHAFNSIGALSERNEIGARALAPFDLKRSGTLLGEGAAYFLLEEEAAARARCAPILAEVAGYGASMDAHHCVIPDPTGRGAAAAMRAALADARLTPDSIGYINAHGTGTPHNDAMESRAIFDVFGEYAAMLPVSSIKPFVGHLLTAAGAVEAAASLLPFARGLLPPTLHFENPDPACKLDVIPNVAREGRPQYVMTNSYGLGGQNASLILSAPASLTGLMGGR